MISEIIALPLFVAHLKKLRKKYPGIRDDYEVLLNTLERNPESGVLIPGFPIDLYKIRMPSRDQKRGKRGGFRVVYYLKQQKDDDEIVYLLTIYSKSKQENFDRELILSALKRAKLA